jgi:cytochrome c553
MTQARARIRIKSTVTIYVRAEYRFGSNLGGRRIAVSEAKMAESLGWVGAVRPRLAGVPGNFWRSQRSSECWTSSSRRLCLITPGWLRACGRIDGSRIVQAVQPSYPEVQLLKHSYGRGAFQAIRSGTATAEIVGITMADLSDDPAIVP